VSPLVVNAKGLQLDRLPAHLVWMKSEGGIEIGGLRERDEFPGRRCLIK